MNDRLKDKYGSILVQFYSVKNFGDDMFVKLMADRFPHYELAVLCNPLHVPTWLPENVHVCKMTSWLININKKIAKILNNRFSKRILAINESIIGNLRKRADASVIITGSLYMDRPDFNNEKPIDFSLSPKVERVYSISSSFKNGGGGLLLEPILGQFITTVLLRK